MFDVFLLDSDFEIQRPTRYYRQGLNLLRDTADDEERKVTKSKGKGKEVEQIAAQRDAERDIVNGHLGQSGDVDCTSTFGSLKSKMSRVFKLKKAPELEAPSRPSGSGSGPPRRVSIDDTVSAASTVSLHSTPILDPSTNTNPLLDQEETHGRPDPSEKQKARDEMSKHTFYVKNSQMKLKINAKNERHMLQWIAALEKAAASCHFTKKCRFDSFAPIRLNAAAQWLVDGVSCRSSALP